MKDYDKNKYSSYLKYWDVNYLYGWAMSQKLLANRLEWIEDTSQFHEDFIKNYNERYFIGSDIQYLEKFHYLHNDLPFFNRKNETSKNLKAYT